MKPLLKAPFVRRMTTHLSKDDEEAIAAAVIPAPEPAEPELIAAFRGQQLAERKVIMQAVPIAAAAMIPGFAAHSVNYVLAVGSAVIVLLIMLFVVNSRCHIEEGAEKMTLPVHHTEEGSSRDYAVVYLPDGKYRIRCELNQPKPVSLTVLKSEGRTYCKLNGKDNLS